MPHLSHRYSTQKYYPVAKPQVDHIKRALDNLYTGIIDLTDLTRQNRSKEEIQRAFYTRAFAAYSLHILADATIIESADSVTDGYEDEGIDAIYYDDSQSILYLVQSKIISDGNGEPETGEVRKFRDGIFNLLDWEGKSDRFNEKIQKKEAIIRDALGEVNIKLSIVLAYTGKISAIHNQNIIKDLIDSLNDSTEWAYFNDFNLKSAHGTLDTILAGKPIDKEILLSNWGSIDEPYITYYGLMSASELATLWKDNRKKLFAENLRSFIGISEINSGILNTIEQEPDHFVYFNNGVTALCSEIIPVPAKTTGKTTGIFLCKGIQIINGAQTVGSLGIAMDRHQEQLQKCKVFIRLIPLNKCPDDFGRRITINSNTQNKIEKRDFVSLDPLQKNLRTELSLIGINYHYKRTDEIITHDESNCTLEEATIALACNRPETTLAVTAKREMGRLWESIDSPPYTTIFNSDLKSIVMWRAILIYRTVAKTLNESKISKTGKEKSVYTYGNYFILNLVFEIIEKEALYNPNMDFEKFKNEEITPELINSIAELIYTMSEEKYPTSLIHQLFRNYTKCTAIKTAILELMDEVQNKNKKKRDN